MRREVRMKIPVQILWEPATLKFGGSKRTKFGATLDNFRLYWGKLISLSPHCERPPRAHAPRNSSEHWEFLCKYRVEKHDDARNAQGVFLFLSFRYFRQRYNYRLQLNNHIVT